MFRTRYVAGSRQIYYGKTLGNSLILNYLFGIFLFFAVQNSVSDYFNIGKEILPLKNFLFLYIIYVISLK